MYPDTDVIFKAEIIIKKHYVNHAGCIVASDIITAQCNQFDQDQIFELINYLEKLKNG